MNKSISLIIGADVVPTKSNKHLFELDGNTLLDSKLKDQWLNADFRLFNLESPITDKGSPIEKCGPGLRASTKTINGIKTLNPSLVLLANNHIMDQGIQGLESTITLLEKNNIPFIGVGKNINQIKHSYVIEKNGIKIAIYNCAEHEFSIATVNSYGVNPFDPFESLDHITELKKHNDYVIVCYHGGKEYYPYPSPYLQKAFRKMSDKGADIVIAQHTHCIGCEETYNNSKLIYGQGNFIFDIINNENSLLIKVVLSKEKIDIDYIPITNKKGKIEIATKNKEIIQEFLNRSEEIKDSSFVLNKYKIFAHSFLPFYLRIFKGNSFFDKVLYKISEKLFLFFFKKKNLLAIQNFIECEAHRELLLEGIKNESKKP